MKIHVALFVALMLSGETDSQRSILDTKFSPLFRFGQEAFNVFIQPKSFKHDLKINLKRGTVQKQFPSDAKFFCDVDGPGARSVVPPTSVHMLRPGDIDVIGAIGDSLTAGNGIFAVDVLQVLLQGRGVSWSAGGQKSWRNFLTVPNILKEFNPKLYGYSTADQASSSQKSSKFNVAEAGAIVSDTVHQSKNLVKRMRNDPNVSMTDHWKLITYMIGANDFCLDICYNNNQDEVIEKAANNLKLALRILRENLPRSLINVVLPPDVSILTRLKNTPDECKSLHYLECPCLFSANHQRNLGRTFKTIKRFQKRISEVTKLPEFHARNDFEVTLHPFLVKTDIPLDATGSTDFKYMSKDCFHLSQIGHARAANAYWNSMFTPEGKRDFSWKKEFQEFRCPTFQDPYLKTTKNS